jgi:hypothetical protein
MSQSPKKWYRVLAALTCWCPGLALAQSEATQGEAPVGEAAPATAEPARKMDLSTPPPPPPRARKARVHNGFYLRGSFGAGGLWPSLLDRSDAADRSDVDGGTFALSFDAMVGGSPTDGFALGGGVSWLGGMNEISDDDVETTVGLLFVGPFFDAFPDPKRGWHLGAMAGYALHTIQDHPSGVSRTRGLGGAAWVGHDFWVSHEMSAGLMLKFSGALTSGEEGSGSLRANSTALTLLATALYH